MDLDILEILIDKDTVLVSIQLVNHEIGSIQPLREISRIVKEINPQTLIHTDAADAYCRIPINVEDLGVDMLTLSNHKILASKGAGALYVRNGVKVEKIIHGALSTQTLWLGVENVPSIVGFHKAAELVYRDFNKQVTYVKELRERLLNGILDEIQEVLVNGLLGEKRVVDNLNVSFLYVEGEAITIELSLNGIYVSSGSACTSRVLEPSHALLAIGRRHEEAHGSILFKLSRYHSPEDVEYTLKVLQESINRLRRISSIKPRRAKNVH